MNRIILFAAFLSLLGCPLPGHCYNGGYSPGFEPFVDVKLFPLQACQVFGSTGDTTTYHCRGSQAGDPALLVRLSREREQELGEIQIKDPSGRQTSRRFKDQPFRFEKVEVYSTDLNRDMATDLIVVLPGTGNGLASEYCDVVFALSIDNDYIFSDMSTMGFGPEDVIDFYGDGFAQIIHSSYIIGEPGKDGKAHNYWVYNFLEVEGTEIKLSQKIPQRWIMFASQENHIPTQQLTEDQKNRLWKKQHKGFFSTDFFVQDR